MKGIVQKDKKKNAPAGDEVQLVTFNVGSEEYGIDIRCVIEVVRPQKITPLPRMLEFVEGVINLRGAIIPIMDLRRRFALSTAADSRRTARMIITKGAVPCAAGTGEGLFGLAVDSVNEVLQVPKKEIEPAPEAATGVNADFITGMGKVGDRLIILLDIARILSQQERTALAEAGNAGY